MTAGRGPLVLLVTAVAFAAAGVGAYAGRLFPPHVAAPADPIALVRVAAGEGLPTFRHVAALVRPAVININTVTVVRNPLTGPRTPMEEFFGEEFFRRFFGEPRELQKRSLGSGVIVDPSGIALTNAHVVEGASEIEIVTADGKKHRARVLGADAKSDVAALRVVGEGSFPIGSSPSGARSGSPRRSRPASSAPRAARSGRARSTTSSRRMPPSTPGTPAGRS